jgi:hypothetical protein
MRGIFTSLLGTVALLLVAGCGGEGGAGGGFNNTLADLQAKLTASEKKIEDVIEFAHGEEWAPKRKAALDEFTAAVTDARTRFDAVTVPPGEAAKKFHAGFAEYLKVQEAAVPLYRKLLTASGKNAFEQQESTREPLRKVRERRTALAQQLAPLQQAYASEAGLKLKK